MFYPRSQPEHPPPQTDHITKKRVQSHPLNSGEPPRALPELVQARSPALPTWQIFSSCPLCYLPLWEGGNLNSSSALTYSLPSVSSAPPHPCAFIQPQIFYDTSSESHSPYPFFKKIHLSSPHIFFFTFIVFTNIYSYFYLFT